MARVGQMIESANSDRSFITEAQRRFASWTTDVLVYIVVLNLFVEWVDAVQIDSFTISLLTAILLQVLLKATLALEHRIATYFKARPGRWSLPLRALATWLVLLGSKFVILEIVDIVFGEHVEFGGVVPFIVVVVALLLAEAILERVYRALR